MLLTDFLSVRGEILDAVKSKLEAFQWYATPEAPHRSLVRIAIEDNRYDHRPMAPLLSTSEAYGSYARRLVLRFCTDAVSGEHSEYLEDMLALSEIVQLTKVYRCDEAAALIARVKAALEKTASDYQLLEYNRDMLTDAIAVEWDSLVLMSRALED